jgi:hypothetical protein
MDKETAVVLRMLAFQYPRQGADWPATESEEEAEDFFQRNSLNEMGQTPEEAAEVVAYYAQESAALAAKLEEAAAKRAALIQAAVDALPRSRTPKDVAAFAARIPSFTLDEAASLGFDRVHPYQSSDVEVALGGGVIHPVKKPRLHRN